MSCLLKLPRLTTGAMATKILVFEHKIGYNSAFRGDKSANLSRKSYKRLRVFRVDKFIGVIETCLRPSPIAMVTKILVLEHKMGYNSTCIGNMPQILAPDQKFANLTMSSKSVSDVAMVSKFFLHFITVFWHLFHK